MEDIARKELAEAQEQYRWARARLRRAERAVEQLASGQQWPAQKGLPSGTQMADADVARALANLVCVGR